MGKLIDVNKWFKDTFPKADLDYPILDNKKAYPHWSIDITGLAYILNDAESVEAISKADYENRLKADLKAILVELKLEMEEYEPKWVENDEQAVASCRTWEDLDGLIQQKINALEDNSHE